MYRQLSWCGVLACMLAAALPASACAAFVERFGANRVLVRALEGERNDVTVEPALDAMGLPAYRITDDGSDAPSFFDGCTPTADPRTGLCTALDGDQIFVDLADGDDRVVQSAPNDSVLCGGPGDDSLTGGPAADLIGGDGGDDTLSGRDGNDALDAESSLCLADVPDVTPPPGDNVLRGDAGNDAIDGGRGRDDLAGGAGDDELYAFAGDDRLAGGDGLDFLSGDDGQDELDGGADRDILCGGLGNDTERGGEGNDAIGVSYLARENCRDGGDDVLAGEAGDDTLDAGPGRGFASDDTTLGTPALPDAANGADAVSGGPGRDTVTYAGRTASVMVSIGAGAADDGAAGEGDDVASDVEEAIGGAGDDVLTGTAAADRLDGGDGSDTVTGAAGDDSLLGGGTDAGADRLSGGTGADRLEGAGGPDLLTGAEGADTVLGGGGDDELDGGSEDDRLAGGPGLDRLAGGPGDDVLEGAATPLIGADGADVIDGGEGRDTATGGPGDDTLAGGPGPDLLSGGDGDADAVDYGPVHAPVRVSFDGVANDGAAGERDNVASDIETLNGGLGDETVRGTDRAERLRGSEGEDYLDGAGGSDELDGGRAGDVLRARDGIPDRVGCGPGVDFAIVDPFDRVQSDCELVDEGASSPVAGQRAVVQPSGGAVAIRAPGGQRLVPLLDRVALRLPARIDTSTGAVRIVVAVRGARRSARVSNGLFTIGTNARHAEIRMARVARRACAAGATRRTKPLRRLRVRASGALRVYGARGFAVGKRGDWVVQELCAGTRYRVRGGRVTVIDRARRKRIELGAGAGYLVRRR